MDRIEQYIKDNRSAFDQHEPPKFLWEQISEELETSDSKNNSLPKSLKDNIVWLVARMAAVFALVLAAGVVIGYHLSSDNNSIDMDRVAKIEQQYIHTVNHRMNELRHYQLDPQLEGDLQQMDVEMGQIRNELRSDTYMNENDLIEALIQNYEKKIGILERVLTRMEDSGDIIIEYNDLKDDSISI